MSTNNDTPPTEETLQREAHEGDPLLSKSPEEIDDASGGTQTCSDTEDKQGIFEGFVDKITDVYDEAKEMTSDLVENVTEYVGDFGETVQETIVEEFHDLAEVFVEELHEADDGDNYFLDMTLARNISILPSDLIQAAATAAAQDAPTEGEALEDLVEGQEELKPPEAVAIPLSAYLLLASAVISLSSIGPLLDIQIGCTSTMKIYWRMSATSIALFPLALAAVRRDGLPGLTIPQWATFLLAAASYTTMCVGFVLALQWTTVGNAVILSNSQALILLLGKLCVGAPVSLLEGSGAMLAFGGAFLCARDSSEGAASTGGLSMLGDILGFIAGLGGVGYLVFAKTVRQHMGLYVFMFLMMFTGSCLALLFAILVLGEHVTFDRDPNHGIWGWSNLYADRLPLEVTMVLICNMLGSLGYVRAMQYFDNIVIAVAALMEPVVAEFLAVGLGVGSMPGWKGWLGNACVMFGTLFVVSPSGGNKKASSVGH